MDVTPLAIPDVKVISPRVFEDERGWFMETFSETRYARSGVVTRAVQMNHSCSVERGVVRGLHFQRPPFEQDKLVRVLRGAIWDVAVDLRKDSPTYGRWAGARISASEKNQIFVPSGFGHGFVTLEPMTEVEYTVSAPYAPDHEGGIVWDDPDLAIDWAGASGLNPESFVINARDRELPGFAGVESPFWVTG